MGAVDVSSYFSEHFDVNRYFAGAVEEHAVSHVQGDPILKNGALNCDFG